MSKQVEQFHKLALRNPLLQKQLKAAVDRPAFVRLAVQLGREHGYNFTIQEVEVYIDRNLLALMSQFS